MYHLACRELPDISDPDLIGAWMEDDAAVIFFHRNKDSLIKQLCGESGATKQAVA